MSYFVIWNPSGETFVREFSDEAALATWLEGKDSFIDPNDASFALGHDTNYWDRKVMVIRGDMVRVTPPGDWRFE